MEFHQGRLIDHLHLRVRNFEASKIFYRAVLAALGREPTYETEAAFISDELFIDQATDYTSRVHLAFQARSHDDVHTFHAAGLASGGTDNGGPGERDYHPGYYGAFLLDPDGNNIEAVFHGPSMRSSEDVVVTPT